MKRHQTNGHRPRMALVAAMAALSLISSPVPPARVSAGPPHGLAVEVVAGTGLERPLTASEFADVQMAATQAGVDPEEAARRHVGASDVALLTTAFESDYAESFVVWGVSRADEPGDFWMVFKGQPGDDLLAQVAELPVDVAVMSGAPASGAELSVMIGAMVMDLSRYDALSFVGSSKDRYSQTITIQYSIDDAMPAITTDDLDAFLGSARRAGQDAIGDSAPTVVVLFEEVVVDAPTRETLVEGGRTLYFPNNNPACTGGFTAQVNGQKGILTAQHCDSDMDYNSVDGVISESPVNATNDSSGGAIDIQWHKTLTGHTTNKQFRATSYAASGDRTVTAVANAGIDSAVCRWGWSTGNSCSFVKSVNDCITWDGGGVTCGIDRADHYISRSGDSGGPWFFGETARGIHAGGNADNGSLWTRISRVAGHFTNAFVLQN